MDNAQDPRAPQHGAAQYYEQIVQSLTSGVIALDASGIIVVANPAAARHLGLKNSLLHPGTHYRDVLLPEPFAAVLAEALTNQQPVSRREIVLEQSDVPPKEIGLSVSPIHESRRFQGIVSLFVDMTERRVLERNAEVNSQLAQVGELAAGVVHEVRNPLSVIVGTAELLQRKMADAALQQHLRTILNETRNIESGINGFLGFAKPFELTLASCHVDDIIDRAYQLCQTQAEKKGVKLIVERNTSLPEIRADAARLAQALANIISNGIDAAGGGAVSVSVSHSPSEVCFEISDTGPGIVVPPGKNVFAPFFTQRAGGTGLGLAICHRIVNAHGGSVAYVCPPEGGTRFYIRIPIGTTWSLDSE